jgi:hypothetical protein
MRGKQLNQDEKLDIIDKYQNSDTGIEALSKMFGVGKLKIKDVLIEANIEFKKKGNQSKNNYLELTDNYKLITFESETGEYIAICKQTGKVFKDANNYSGALTAHLKTLYPEIDVPANTYHNKRYELEHGKKWYSDYFDIQEVDKKETKKCSYCDWETEDILNRTGCFEVHLKKTHNIDLSEYLNDYPEDINYFSNYKDYNDVDSFVSCLECGEKMGIINNRHLEKHNMTVNDYKIKYPSALLVSKKSSKRLSEATIINNMNMTYTWTSKGELEVKAFVESLGYETTKAKNRGLLLGKEIDILIESAKLCIEYNGLYYHTENFGRDYKYHLDKTLACNNAGYSLIHIFEDEWQLKKTIVESKLRHILRKSNGISIGARKCIIKEISSKTKSDFLNEYHIQGNDKSNILIGAFYDELLIGVITFNNKRNMTSDLKEGEFELTRFATNSDYIISGLCSKMVKYFIKKYNPKKIISFADRRWTLDALDNMYTKIGFKLANVVKPSYTYYSSKVNKHKRFHKYGFGKKNLAILHPYLDMNKSETELMTELGYSKIWDCGLFKYEMVL